MNVVTSRVVQPGQKLAHYEVVEPIGKGGMGEVYRARDTKLNRDVALKIVPEALADDRDRMARFEREAQLLASLNHPNIAAIYGIEEQSGTRALVLELVAGETLSERVARGPMALNEALDLARQIAEALEAAHEIGIINRDLKPANVIVKEDGQVKVLDFGLAKAIEGGDDADEVETSPTLSFAATRAGVILGTASYMSPEQARGHKADRRSDIWSFGVVLFEMLSGKRLFTGNTPSDVLAHVLTAEPRWEELDVPRSVSALLRRCLTRERKKRLQAIGEARIAIEDHMANPDRAPEPKPVAGGRSRLSWAVISLVAAGLVAASWIASRSSTDATSPWSFEVKLDSRDVGLFEPTVFDGASAVLSPDGSTLAFVARTAESRRQIYVRPLDQLEATALGGTDGARTPFFSPDGRWLAFFVEGALKRVSLSGGAALTIAEVPDPRGGSWGPDGNIVFTPGINTGLYRVAASGGTPVELTELGDDERSHRWPRFLPDGRGVLYVAQAIGEGYDDANIEVVLDSGERRVLHRGGSFPSYLASGHLLFIREATLFAIPFDARGLEVTGEPTPVLEGIRAGVNGSAQYYVSDLGTLVYLRGGPIGRLAPLAVADRSGAMTMLPLDPARFADLRLSPDETRLALSVGDADGRDVHILDLERGAMSRLTFGGGRNANPIWSPDGQRIVFSSDRHGGSVPNLYTKRADGAGVAERLTTSQNPQAPESFSPDGKVLIYSERRSETGSDLWTLSMDDGLETVPLLATPAAEGDASVSPDGRWIAYASDPTGRELSGISTGQVYVEPFPGPGGKYQVSIVEGRFPRWTRGGRELVYLERGRWMAVSVSTSGDVFRADKPELLFEGDFAGLGPWGYYDVSADGERFYVFPRAEQEAEQQHVTFVLDFDDEVRRLTGR